MGDGGVIRAAALALAMLTGLAAQAGPSARASDGEPSRRDGAIALAALVEAPPRPREREADTRCTRNRATCITRANYLPDVCRAIEAAARGSGLDPHFLARLIWRESLFDAAAVSPAGAQGIAQFMPETARLRGLADPFNPAEALHASAAYLAEMRRGYGNLGLAAAAYNAGEARVERFVAEGGGLPLETRAYVRAITGHSVETWRDAAPAALDVALAAGSFQPACVALAAGRGPREFLPPVPRWGVILASNRERGGAERQVARLANRHAAVLAGEPVVYTYGRTPGMPRRMHLAQVGRASRAEADALCARLRADGGACMVLRN